MSLKRVVLLFLFACSMKTAGAQGKYQWKEATFRRLHLQVYLQRSHEGPFLHTQKRSDGYSECQ